MVILDMNYASFIIVYMSYCLFISSVNISCVLINDLIFFYQIDTFIQTHHCHDCAWVWIFWMAVILLPNKTLPVIFMLWSIRPWILIKPSRIFGQTVPYDYTYEFLNLKKKNGWKSLHLIWYLQVNIKLLSHQCCVLKTTLLRPWKTQNA